MKMSAVFERHKRFKGQMMEGLGVGKLNERVRNVEKER